jgi:polyisoprenoid-binding protein YceI
MTTQSAPAKLAPWTLDVAHTSVEFSVKHMMFSTARGRFNKFDATVNLDEQHPEKSSVQVKIDVASVDTREAKRDEHLRTSDFFDSATYPHMTFNSKKVVAKGHDRYDVVGDLTIRGVKREVVLDAAITGILNDPWGFRRAGFSAQAAVSRKDYGVKWNVALEAGGIAVGDEVKITIDGELVQAKG